MASLGLTHEVLNSDDLATKQAARLLLAKFYPAALVICEDVKGGSKRYPETIDGVLTKRHTFASLTAAALAKSGHGLRNYNFVSFDKIDSLIEVTDVQETHNDAENAGIIPAVLVGVLGGGSDAKALEEPSFLRSIEEIDAQLEKATTEGGEVQNVLADGQTELFASLEAAKETPKEAAFTEAFTNAPTEPTAITEGGEKQKRKAKTV